MTLFQASEFNTIRLPDKYFMDFTIYKDLKSFGVENEYLLYYPNKYVGSLIDEIDIHNKTVIGNIQ